MLELASGKDIVVRDADAAKRSHRWNMHEDEAGAIFARGERYIIIRFSRKRLLRAYLRLSLTRFAASLARAKRQVRMNE